MMPILSSPVKPRLLLFGRVVLATLGQWLTVLLLGTIVYLLLDESNDLAVHTLLWILFIAIIESLPASLLLLVTLCWLRMDASAATATQRWLGLLAGITLCSLVAAFGDNWSVLWDDPGIGIALTNCLPWILIAYAFIPWANRKYLRGASFTA